jgi:hypothetical protein
VSQRVRSEKYWGDRSRIYRATDQTCDLSDDDHLSITRVKLTEIPVECTSQVNARFSRFSSTPMPYIQLEITQPIPVRLGSI